MTIPTDAVRSWLSVSWRRLALSHQAKRLAKGAAWNLVGTGLSRGGSLLATVVIARLLGQRSFGELGIIQSTVGVAGIAAGFGMGLTATKFVAEYRLKDAKRAGNVIALSSLVSWVSGAAMALCLSLLAPWVCSHPLAAPHLSNTLQVGSLLLLFGAVNGAQNGALAGFEAFRQIARVNFFAGIITFALMVAGAWAFGLEGAVWGMVSSLGANTLVNFLALRERCAADGVRASYIECLTESPILWRFAIPAMLSGAVITPAAWVANVFLVNQPNGYAEMGLFNVATQWRNVVVFLPNVLLQVALPMLSSAASSESDSFQNTIQLTQRALVTFSFPLCTLMMFCAEWLLIPFGEQYSAARLALVGVGFAAMVQSIGSALGPALQAKGRMWVGFALNLSWGCFHVAISFLLVGILGAAGLSFSSAGAYVLLTFWGFHFIRSDLPRGMQRRIYLTLLVAICSMAVCLLTPERMRPYAGIPCAALMYFIAKRTLLGSSGLAFAKSLVSPATGRRSI